MTPFIVIPCLVCAAALGAVTAVLGLNLCEYLRVNVYAVLKYDLFWKRVRKCGHSTNAKLVSADICECDSNREGYKAQVDAV